MSAVQRTLHRSPVEPDRQGCSRMETGGYVRCFGIAAGERRHAYGFESHPPHHCRNVVTCRYARLMSRRAGAVPHEYRTEPSYACPHGLQQDEETELRGDLAHRLLARRGRSRRRVVQRDLRRFGLVKPDEPAVPAAEMFVVYAHTYVGLLTDISDHTRTNYTRFILVRCILPGPNADRTPRRRSRTCMACCSAFSSRP